MLKNPEGKKKRIIRRLNNLVSKGILVILVLIDFFFFWQITIIPFPLENEKSILFFLLLLPRN